jgi:hypothetical protein
LSNILLKVPEQGEMDLDLLCELEYKRIIAILGLLETTLNINLNNYPDIRKNILDTGNFIRRLPNIISEVLI